MSKSIFIAQSIPPRKYTNKLHNKHILIFGGTSGIGYCIAEACLENGAHVTISGSNKAKLEKALSRLRNTYPDISTSNIKGYTCDLSPPDTYNINTNDPNTKTTTTTLETNLTYLLKQTTSEKSRPIHHIAFTAGDSLEITPVKDLTLLTILQSGTVRFSPLYFSPKSPHLTSPNHRTMIPTSTPILLRLPPSAHLLPYLLGPTPKSPCPTGP